MMDLQSKYFKPFKGTYNFITIPIPYMHQNNNATATLAWHSNNPLSRRIPAALLSPPSILNVNPSEVTFVSARPSTSKEICQTFVKRLCAPQD